jgi:hypothetical protein
MKAKRKDEPAATLAACLARFEPEIAALATTCLERLRKLVPGAKELVYDAYNALAIPFGTGERLGDTFVGITVYPRHVNLNFLRGAELDDTDGLLVGVGSKIRHIRVDDEALFDDARVLRLVRAAADLAGFKAVRGARGEIVVKKIYVRQRPRRPG